MEGLLVGVLPAYRPRRTHLRPPLHHRAHLHTGKTETNNEIINTLKPSIVYALCFFSLPLMDPRCLVLQMLEVAQSEQAAVVGWLRGR